VKPGMIDLEEYPDNTGEEKEKAELSGFQVIIATDYMLQLDLDTIPDLSIWGRYESRLQNLGVSVKNVESWPSKSGNKHVVIHLTDPVPVIERIAIQLILGSDRKRESLAFRDVKAGYEFPLMLFRPQQLKIAPPKIAGILDGTAPF
jgi:hypothetical protein